MLIHCVRYIKIQLRTQTKGIEKHVYSLFVSSIGLTIKLNFNMWKVTYFSECDKKVIL